MIERVGHNPVALEREAIDVVRRPSPARPWGFERLGDAYSPGIARIRVSNWSSWFILNNGDIGNDRSSYISTSRRGRSKMPGICLYQQWIVWCLHPRRPRLGLIEAPSGNWAILPYYPASEAWTFRAHRQAGPVETLAGRQNALGQKIMRPSPRLASGAPSDG